MIRQSLIWQSLIRITLITSLPRSRWVESLTVLSRHSTLLQRIRLARADSRSTQALSDRRSALSDRRLRCFGRGLSQAPLRRGLFWQQLPRLLRTTAQQPRRMQVGRGTDPNNGFYGDYVDEHT